MPARALLAPVLAALTLLPVAVTGPRSWPGGDTPGPAVRPDVLAMSSDPGGEVTAVVALDPVPPAPVPAAAVSVTAGGRRQEVRWRPVLSGPAMIVVDASAAAGPALRDGGSAAAAGFLLQLPPGTPNGLIADRSPPDVLSPVATGVAAPLRALATVTPGGDRDTAAALTLALRRAGSSAPPLITLFTTAPDAGRTPAGSLVGSLRRAHAVLAVVVIAPDARFWTGVAGATGGPAVRTDPGRALTAADQVADTLRGRYLLSFRPPATASTARLAVTSGATTTTASLPLPRTGPAGPAATAAGHRWTGLPWMLVLAAVVGLLLPAVTGTAWARRRSGSRADRPRHRRAGSPVDRPRHRRAV